jgi:hypothetical protein
MVRKLQKLFVKFVAQQCSKSEEASKSIDFVLLKQKGTGTTGPFCVPQEKDEKLLQSI